MNKNILNNFLTGKPYLQKIYFDIFKKYDYYENNAFITFVSKGIIEYDEFSKQIIPLVEDKDYILISLTKEQEKNIDIRYKDYKKILFLTDHPENFHQLFDTYIYYHTGYFDPHPRMFHECIFYNKKIIYINNENVKDGGYYRYNDAIKNGLKNHSMSIKDDIIQRVIHYENITSRE